MSHSPANKAAVKVLSHVTEEGTGTQQTSSGPVWRQSYMVTELQAGKQLWVHAWMCMCLQENMPTTCLPQESMWRTQTSLWLGHQGRLLGEGS